MQDLFKNKKPNYAKLLNFGFKKKGNIYKYKQEILNGQFELLVTIEGKDVTTKLTETESGELYTLHLIDGVSGNFIGQIKEEYESVLQNIASKCFETDVFKYKQTFEVLDYVNKKYETEPEYLWEKFPRNAVCRRKDNQKWFLAILSVKGSTIGLETNEIVEIIDVRAKKDEIENLLSKKNEIPIFPAYHMNKKNWITIVLDESVNSKIIFDFIDKSYILAKK